MTDAQVTELDVAALAAPASSAQTMELDVAVLAAPPTAAQTMELDVAVLIVPTTETGAQTSELDVAVLAYIGPRGTKRATFWKITRTDGVVLAYTSATSDITWLGVGYKTCRSLAQSATEMGSDLNSVGSVEITGMITSTDITDQDLYAGKYDDAYVEVWLMTWDGSSDDATPNRLAAGYVGKCTRQEHAWKSDILGPAGRLQQTAIVDFFTPGCLWDFGVLDSNGVGCPVDVESLEITDVVVTGQQQRTLIFFDCSTPGGSATWNNGQIIWTSGKNNGVTCQTNTVDFGAQALQLWDIAPYPPAVGDTFTLRPGCDHTEDACKNYNVYISFGGFPDVPGPDALQSNADSLFTGSGG